VMAPDIMARWAKRHEELRKSKKYHREGSDNARIMSVRC
jgi:hypothetical protein